MRFTIRSLAATFGIKSIKLSIRSNQCRKDKGSGKSPLLDFFAPAHTPSSYLKAILSRDRRTYGVAPGAVAVTPDNATMGGDEPLIQQRIEDLIEAPGGATDF